jgi:hypothetical protein
VAGGDLLAWSARGVRGGPDIHNPQPLGNDASRATGASNVHQWAASPDGARWYWLSAVVENTRAGVLQTAPFPGGASPTMVAANTVGYEFPTPTSMISVNTSRQLLAYVDPAGAPATSQVLDTGVLGLVNISQQGHVAYAKAAVMSGTAQFVDLYMKKPDVTGACTVSATTDAYLRTVFFNPSASGLAWILRASGNVQARFTRLSDCLSMAVSTGAVWTEPAGDRGVLYIDSVTDTGTGSLRYLPVGTGGEVSAGPATLVSAQVGGFNVVSSGAADAAIYTVNAGGSEDGVYVRSIAP